MTLSSAINSAKSGLQITSLRADIAATNVSNASTPGYVSRALVVSEKRVGESAGGVQAIGISRSQNYALTAERRSLTSDYAQADMLTSTWKTISAQIGNSSEGTGLFKAFSGLESTLSDLALSPESSSNASAVLRSAKSVVQEFHDLSQMVDSLRAEADHEIANGVDTVNSALKTIQDINGRLSSIDRSSSQAAGLIDERNRALDTISEYMPVQAVDRQYGTIDVITPEGVYLLSGTARKIEFNPTSAFSQGDTLANGTLSGMTVDGISITPGSSSYGAVSSGVFGALFTLRDQDLPAVGAQLDALAGDLITRFSDDALDPTKTPGEQGIFVDSTGAGGIGLASRISVNAAIDPDQGGGTWRLRDGLGATTPGPTGNTTILNGLLGAFKSANPVNSAGIQGSFSSVEMVAQFASLAGQSRIQNETVLSSTSSQHAMLLGAEQAQNGVDVDSQMQDLLLIEQAYAANARVIEIASQMIQRLMEI